MLRSYYQTLFFVVVVVVDDEFVPVRYDVSYSLSLLLVVVEVVVVVDSMMIRFFVVSQVSPMCHQTTMMAMISLT